MDERERDENFHSEFEKVNCEDGSEWRSPLIVISGSFGVSHVEPYGSAIKVAYGTGIRKADNGSLFVNVCRDIQQAFACKD
jgi:hypothetical protein